MLKSGRTTTSVEAFILNIGLETHGELAPPTGYMDGSSLKKLQAHLRQQQEVVEQEPVELLAALGFEQLPAVEELPGTQTVGDGVKHQLLKDRDVLALIFHRDLVPMTGQLHHCVLSTSWDRKSLILNIDMLFRWKQADLAPVLMCLLNFTSESITTLFWLDL